MYTRDRKGSGIMFIRASYALAFAKACISPAELKPANGFLKKIYILLPDPFRGAYIPVQTETSGCMNSEKQGGSEI